MLRPYTIIKPTTIAPMSNIVTINITVAITVSIFYNIFFETW